ncbi:MAG: hypothetical protein IJH86_08870 [Clostridia bacterium]|nr:hypothetical protein [Clostridia bacterium]
MSDMSENKVGRHARPKPTGVSALRSAENQARGKSAAKGLKTRADVRQAGKKRAPKKARRPVNSENLKTALWLWCFPVGLSKMWRKACTWPRGVKIGITAAMAAVLLAIFVIPTPTADRYTTGIQMVADKPEVEVYGPALPALIVQGYTRENTGSIIVDQVANDVHYVYAADGAECYHEYECKFAFASSQRLTVYEAYHLGFKPCGRCNPPVYVPGETDPITAQPLNKTAEAQPAPEDAPEENIDG